MAKTRRSEVVSLASLSKSIDKAVNLAAKRHDVVFERENLIHNWEIFGRILREMTGPGQSELDVATTVLRNLPGIKGQPTVVKLGREILVGFIERVGGQVRF